VFDSIFKSDQFKFNMRRTVQTEWDKLKLTYLQIQAYNKIFIYFIQNRYKNKKKKKSKFKLI
jgi:hypothetical protein